MSQDDEGPFRPPNGGSRPVPDPTELTDRAIARLEKALVSYIDSQLAIRDTRLDAIDEATKLRLAAFEHIPTEIDEKIKSESRLAGIKFEGIQTQFKERDYRAERESRDNKVAVDAAFAAQKEAAAKQDEANAKAIDKSEKATAETIITNLALTRTTTDALTESLDEVRQTVAGQVAGRAGAKEDRTALYATIAAAAVVVGIVIAIAGFVIRL